MDLQRVSRKSFSSEIEGERMRFRDVEAKDVPLHENADHIRSLYSQQIMSAASATAYGLIGLLMGFVNKFFYNGLIQTRFLHYKWLHLL